MGISVGQRIWIAIRLIGYRSNDTKEKMNATFKSLQDRHNVVVCDLPIIMRTPASITKVAESKTTQRTKCVSNYTTGAHNREVPSSFGKPVDTVAGLSPWFANTTATSKHFKKVIQRVQHQACGKSMVILLPHEFSYTSKVEDCLKEMKESYLMYRFSDENSDVKELQEFLDGQRNILITDLSTFTGMEASVIVSFETKLLSMYKTIAKLQTFLTNRVALDHAPRDVILRSSAQLFEVCVENPSLYHSFHRLGHSNDLGSFRSPIGHLVDLYFYVHFHIPLVCAGKVYDKVNNWLNKWRGGNNERRWLHVLTFMFFYLLLMIGVGLLVNYSTWMFSLMTAEDVANVLMVSYPFLWSFMLLYYTFL